ncbi:MAG: flavin monoamine oxidase family protein [Rhodospirillaceae bacterium]
MDRPDVLIIGGGLSGLALADHLQRDGVSWQLLEAGDRLGGRIFTETIDGASFDMGPAWFWPGQPRMASLAKRFGLRVFEQYADGDQLAQDSRGKVYRGGGFASMAGSWRLEGGMTTLIDALAAGLPAKRITTNAPVTGLVRKPDQIEATLSDGRTVSAAKVVLALPPRPAAANITFDPPLPTPALQAMAAVPTWMAGHAKLLALYDHPFWRAKGLSGDAMSQIGPLAEIHDASPYEGRPYALFGFVGVPAALRLQQKDALLNAARAQLASLFGPAAAEPKALLLRDWAEDPLVATPADHDPPRSHPQYGPPAGTDRLWDGALLLGSTEIGQAFGGFLEGALEAAETTAQRLQTVAV